MTDLFESIEEARVERFAIMQESNVPNAVESASDDLHKCEVQAVMRQFYPDGDKAKEYFELVEKKRGHLAAQRLRDDVREEWKKRRVEMAVCPRLFKHLPKDDE